MDEYTTPLKAIYSAFHCAIPFLFKEQYTPVFLFVGAMQKTHW